jgi:type II secretory pathway pseudopilin PulG
VKSRQRTRCSAFTLVELVIGIVLLVVVFGGLGLASTRALALFENATTTNDVNSRAARACDRLARELFGASSRNLLPDLETPPGNPVVWSPSVEHRIGARWEDGEVVWSERQLIAWELEPGETNNGLDDDNDGLVDEGMVVSGEEGMPGDRRVTIVNGVPELLEGEQANGLDDNGNGLVDESGLCFDLADGALRIHLTVQVPGPDGALIQRTQEVSVWPRNTDS